MISKWSGSTVSHLSSNFNKTQVGSVHRLTHRLQASIVHTEVLYIMSLFNRIIPSALCCFHQTHHSDGDIQPSPLGPVPHVVPRKPMPYAMINVPHEPEMADVYAFRRLFTQSPACPHEDTPIKAMPERLRPRGSLDLDYTFNSGSPVPAAKKSSSIQKLSQHVKQKMSASRLSKTSSKAEMPPEPDGEVFTPLGNPDTRFESIMLGVSARSTGLSDILRSRDGSIHRYDDDAESIKTPQMLSPAETIRLKPVSTQNNPATMSPAVPDAIAAQEGTECVSRHRKSPKIRSSPFPQSSEKATFGDAMQMEADEPRDVMLRRLSAGIAQGVIKPPSSTELKAFQAPLPETDADERQETASLANLAADPETPSTVVKRVSHQLEHEQNDNSGSKTSEGRSTALLESLDPVLVKYLARSTPSRAVSSMIQEKKRSKLKSMGFDNAQDGAEPGNNLHDGRSCLTEQLRTETVCMRSPTQSQGYKSVHLFDMHISKRLASKSQATFLSPTASGNTSIKSFDAADSIVPASSINSIRTTLKPSGIRAEHNRRPSDSHTRQLFERTEDTSQPYWLRQGLPTKPKVRPLEYDDASSYYTNDGGPPSSAGNLSSFDGTRSIKPVSNSIAIGGRAASYDFPYRRSISFGKSKAQTCSVPQRSFSTSHTQGPDLLGGTTCFLNKSTDGPADDTMETETVNPQIKVSAADIEAKVQNHGTELHDLHNEGKVDTSKQAGADWLNVVPKSGWDYDFVRSSTPRDRRRSALSMIAPDADLETDGESAADMWNRTYRVARDDSKSRALLSPTPLEIEQLRRPSSTNTIRLKHSSDVSHDISPKVARRSQSTGPCPSNILNSDDDRVSPGVSRTLEKLSLLHLRGKNPTQSEDTKPRKLRKRSAPRLSKKSSFITSKQSVSSMLQPGHTPPLKESLGLWGAFPECEQARRNGAAGEADGVYTCDFAGQAEFGGLARFPSQDAVATRQLSSMQQALRALSFRVSKTARKENRSMSFPTGARPSKAALRSRWQRLYRTKSSEWRGYMVGGAHRTSVSTGQLAEYPELETLPGEGLFGSRSRHLDHVQQYDGSMIATGPAVDDTSSNLLKSEAETTATRSPALQVHSFWRPKSDTSLGEPSRQILVNS